MGGMLYYLNGGRTNFERYAIAALMMFTLTAGEHSTNNVLNKLIAYTVNSGALTTYLPHLIASALRILPDGPVFLPSLPWRS
jgi:hypothetical protein